MNNTITGAFITLGLFITTPNLAFCTLLGTGSSTLAALLLDLSHEAFSNGIYGFNGCLIGAGIATFSFGTN